MPRRSAALILALAIPAGVLAPVPAFAQSGTEAEQEACTPDVFRLCQDFIPNEGPILACLQAKHSQLSAACEQVIFPHASVAPGSSATPTPRKHHKHRHKSI